MFPTFPQRGHLMVQWCNREQPSGEYAPDRADFLGALIHQTDPLRTVNHYLALTVMRTICYHFATELGSTRRN
jgi:hypothetical protein